MAARFTSLPSLPSLSQEEVHALFLEATAEEEMDDQKLKLSRDESLAAVHERDEARLARDVARKRNKRMGGAVGLLALFLGLSVACNFVLMTYALEASKETFASKTSNGTLLSTRDGSVAQVTEAKLTAPLYVAPVMDRARLASIKTLHATMSIGVDVLYPHVADAPALVAPVEASFSVKSVYHVNDTAVAFHLHDGDQSIHVLNGEAFLLSADGQTKTTLCAADAECSALQARDAVARARGVGGRGRGG